VRFIVKAKESFSDDGRDENVFDIQQGVCITHDKKNGSAQHNSIALQASAFFHAFRGEKPLPTK
jgi:hypothetical protein